MLAVYVLDPDMPMGSAQRWWLHHSLARLSQALKAAGNRLILRSGPASEAIQDLARASGASAVHWNRCYDRRSIARDTDLKQALQAAGVEVQSHNGSLLFEPWTVKNKEDRPYQTFSSFWRACLAAGAVRGEPAPPLAAPARIPAPDASPARDDLDAWKLLPTQPDWAAGLRAAWTPGEAGAMARLDAFLDGPVEHYAKDRDRPDRDGTSRLSPFLAHGEVSPRQAWYALAERRAAGRIRSQSGADKFLAELGWREFSYSLLYQYPELDTAPLRPAFADFPWVEDAEALSAWQQGRTGYPLVDAGMRELWTTGWMHNRVRMTTASFLVKHLLLPWQAGEAWFWDCLVDADPASNAASWQWVAGCGADAAPYFRIFNPILQAQKFDPDGRYIARWIPEAAAPAPLHAPIPDATGPRLLPQRGADPGPPGSYPPAIVDHDFARKRALAALAEMTRG